MEPTNWIASGDGTSTADSANAGLITLRSSGAGFEQFDASTSPGRSFSLAVETTSAFAVYVNVLTSAGRRQFKFVPGAVGVELRFGYRYQVGLGTDARNGVMQTTNVNLDALAASAEPDVSLAQVGSMFVRLAGGMNIDTDGGAPLASGDLSRAEAVRFLQQATFGPNPEAIEEVMAMGIGGWIDQQLAASPSLTTPYVRANSTGSLGTTRHHIWWINAMEGSDQLRQRMAFAWSQIFVVSDIDYELAIAQYAVSSYYDMLATEGLGSFRNLLEQITLHPVMGIYLSMLRNERADPARNVRPDENFAREVLQLFTIGLYELNDDGTVRSDSTGPIPTFDQVTIEEFAKVFTGWNLAGAEVWVSNDLTKFDKETPMEPVEEYHDRTSKRLLNGTVLPAGQDARTDLSQALDNIVAHPNVGPFVCRLLIQRLVTSNPSPGYVRRVAAVFGDNGGGARGDMAAVIRAVLTDDEARNGHIANPDTFGKIKEPAMRLTQVWRAFSAVPGSDADGIYRPYAKAIDQIEDVLGQAPMRSPSVFNFFQPDHRAEPGGDLVAPEAQILAEIDLASTNNMLFMQIYDDNNRRSTRTNTAVINIDREVALASDIDALIDHLDVLLTAGQLPSDHAAAIAVHLATEHPDASDPDVLIDRCLDAIFCIVGSPFHLVQK